MISNDNQLTATVDATVLPGRNVAANDRDIVVFLIGMRFNDVPRLMNAARIFFSMPGMLAEIRQQPGLGCLSTQAYFSPCGAIVVQYWQSFEELERFARSDEFKHRGAWSWYNRLGRDGRDGGVWHETYRVPAGAYESIAVNMPRIGLAPALGNGNGG